MKKNDHNVVVMVNAEDLENVLQISAPGTYLTTQSRDEESLPFYALLDELGSDHAIHFIQGSGIASLTIRDCTSTHNQCTQVTSYRRNGDFDTKDYLVVHSFVDTYDQLGAEPKSEDWFFMSGYYTSSNSHNRHFIPTDLRIRAENGQDLVKLNHQDISDVRKGLLFIADLIQAQKRGEKPESVIHPSCAPSSVSHPSPSL